MPPLPAGAVHDAERAPSEGVRVNDPGASGQPLHTEEAAVAAVDTHDPSRALTVGVTAVTGTVAEALVPEAPVTTVVPEPFVTS